MKKVKKIIVSFLLMCMLCVGMTCVASATAAEFRFSDPQTSVGAEVEVTAKVSSAKALNTIQATLSYDKTSCASSAVMMLQVETEQLQYQEMMKMPEQRWNLI